MDTLRKSLIPVDPDNVSDAEMSNALAAIRTLGNLARKMIIFLKDNEERPLKPAEVTKYWNRGILSWFTFLFDHYRPSIEADVPTDRRTTISYVSCVFTYFIKADFKLVAETPGAVRLATRLWLDKEYDYMPPSECSLGRGWWDPALELLARGILDRNLKKEFYEVEGVRRKSMINLILKRIEISTEVQEYHDQTQHLRLLDFLDHFHILEPSDDVPFTRIADVLSRKTVYLVKSLDPHSGFPNPHLFTCLLYFQRVQRVLKFAQSIEAVATAIRAGLLGAFVAYSSAISLWKLPHKSPNNRHITDPAVEATIELITKTIPRYMVFDSVLSAIDDEDDLYTYDLSGTVVGQRWEKFCRLFESNVEFLDNTNLPDLCYCDNVKHDISHKTDTIRECSGCEKAKYCSKKCQREDWNAGHRTACRSALKDDMIRHNTLRMQDQISVCRFAIMTTGLQWKSLQERARREHPNLSLSQLTVFFDFTKHPHVIHLRERDAESDPAGYEAARYVPNATVVQCHVTLGLYKVTVTAAGDIDDIENKSWVTRAPEIIGRTLPMSQLPSLPKDARISVDIVD